MRAVAERHGPAHPGELLHGDDVVEVAHAAAPVVGAGRDPQQPHLTQLPPELPLAWRSNLFVCEADLYILKLSVSQLVTFISAKKL